MQVGRISRLACFAFVKDDFFYEGRLKPANMLEGTIIVSNVDSICKAPGQSNMLDVTTPEVIRTWKPRVTQKAPSPLCQGRPKMQKVEQLK